MSRSLGRSDHVDGGRRGAGARRLGAGSAAAVVALATLPALAAVEASAAVTVGENITAFPARDFVGVSGYIEGEPLRVEVLRGGVVVGTATGPATTGPEGTGLEVNHGPAGTSALPGDCWEGVTPDIRGGDVIRVTTGDRFNPLTGTTRPGGVDEMTVADIGLNDDRAVDSGVASITGTVGRTDGVLPTFAVEFRQAPDDEAVPPVPRVRVALRPPTVTEPTWRATTSTTTPLTAEQQAAALNPDTTWMAVAGDATPSTTIVEQDSGTADGPAAGCETVGPAEPNAISDGYQVPFNATSGARVFSGTAREGTTGVHLAVGSLGRDAVLSTNPTGDLTWTVSFTQAEMEALPEGPVTVTPSFTSAAGTLVGTSRTLLKDTQVPGLPTASPGTGTYATAQQVTLNRPAEEPVGTKVHWEIGSATTVRTPDASSRVATGQISVTASQVIKAVSIDAGGNTGSVATFTYTIGGTTTVAPPTVTPTSGTYSTARSVVMSAAAGTTIRYTVGAGTTVPPDPTATSPAYTGPVAVGSSSIVKAAAFDSSGRRSTVVRRNYTITTTTGGTRTVTVVANADTTIRQQAPTTASGSLTSLKVDARETDANAATRATSYVRFTVPTLAAGETITGATLRLQVTNGTTNGPKVFRTATAWNQGTMTWNAGRPARTSATEVGDFGAVPTGTVTTPVSGVTASGGVSFELYADHTDGMDFVSRESTTAASRPRLVLTIRTP